MKQPLLTDKRAGQSSYFMAPKQPNFDENGPPQDVSWKLRFPNSKSDLWNNMPCGDAVIFGIRRYHPLTLLCLKRCLRLAHRHASQISLDEDTDQSQFNGFLMGSAANSEDDMGVVIDIDRFDPGTVRSSGHKTPSTPLPGDIIIPVMFTKGLPQAHDAASTFTVKDYENALKLLHHQVSTLLSAENTSLFPIRLHCFYSSDNPSDDVITLELYWVSPCIANSIRAIPIKPVPIIPTALAKNLSGSLNLSAIQNSSKSGYISMNQSRKLLLLLDSDPKSRSIPTVGIWVSGVVSAHSPIVWLACMRYLHCPDIYERIMADGQFLLVLYSVMSKAPLFFQVKSDDNQKLNFDVLYTKETVQIFKQPAGEPDTTVEFRLESTSESMPNSAFKEREIFLEALENTQELFNAPIKQKLDDVPVQNRQDIDGSGPLRGRQPKKGSVVPQSILRNSSIGRKSSGSRGRSTSTGVSFSLAVDDSEIFTDATPMPLPSPHPSTIAQSPSLVKPSVPELSIIFDENYPAVNPATRRQQSTSPTKKRVMAEKLHSSSPGIRSPLKNIQNLNPTSRGISPQDPRPGPMKPPMNHYFQNSMQGAPHSTAQPFFPQNVQLPPQRRSRSASDCMRGPQGRTNPPYPVPPPPRPIVTHHNVYSSTPMQGFGYSNSVQAPIPAPHPYPSLPQQPRTHAPIRGQYPNQPFPPTQPMTPYSAPSNSYPTWQSTAVSNPALLSNGQASSSPSFHPAAQMNLLVTPSSKTISMLDVPPPCNPAQPQQVPVVNQRNPAFQMQSANPAVIPESPSWMKQLPPEAYQLLMHQDAQLKMLQAQIQKLLAMQEEKQPNAVAKTNTEMGTSTDPIPDAVNSKVSMGTNTGTSLYIPSECKMMDEQSSSDLLLPDPNTPILHQQYDDNSKNKTPQHSEETQVKDIGSQEEQPTSQNKLEQPRCDSQCTDKYPVSEFASIHLDETNIREIASANAEEDSDVGSLASSLKVDLPALETSTEQSSFSTPAQKLQSGIWSAQDSPVLGESASMCIVPPINLNRSLEEAEEDEANADRTEKEEPKDENFMKNLLNQVRDMLKKADVDGTSELSSENSAASTPQRVGKRQKDKKAKCSTEGKVAKATRKQLRKMGVKFNDDTVNVLSSAVMAEEKSSKKTEYPYALPEPLIPRLNYASIFAGASSSESIFRGPSSADLSMHANAIALKYLSNDQLEEIAALSKVGKSASGVFSPLKSRSGSSVSDTRPSVHDIFNADVKKLGEKRLPGMSLVSPCNMSLATRKYMQKYGLIDCEDSSDEEEEVQEVARTDQQERPHTPANQGNHPASSDQSQGVRPTTRAPEVQTQNQRDGNRAPPGVGSYPGFPQQEPGFSELKMNLGDTLDMILPFLDDLGRHRQQTPSSGTNGRDSQSGTRSTETESSRDRMTSVSERAAQQDHSVSAGASEDADSSERILPPQLQRNPTKSKKRSAEARKMRQGRKHKDNEVSQVLSPEILRAVAEGKRLTQTPRGSTQAAYNPPNSHRCSYSKDVEEEEEDFLAGTWPRHQFRSRSESEFFQTGCRNSSKDDRRRMSSSPRYPVDQPMSSRSCKGHQRLRASPPTSSKMKRIRAIHDRPVEHLEDVEEVECQGYDRGEEEEEEPVLTSRVTDAFKEKEELSKNDEELSRRENAPHFLQHLQAKEKRTENDNFLDLDKIRNLPKLE